MNKEFPCKVCTHPARVHWVNVSTEDKVCSDCFGTAENRNIVDSTEYHHEFVGDNFKYLELIEKREEIKNDL